MAMMVRLARGVTIQRTGTDLEALLEEADRIERYRPPFNRALKNRSRGWYIEADWGQPFPRLRITGARRRARAQYLGPFRGRRGPTEAARLVEKVFRLRSCTGSILPDDATSPCLQHGIDLCSAPCIGLAGVDAYRRQVRAAVRCLSESEAVEAAVFRFSARRDEALQAGAIDLATSWDRRIDWLHELERYRAMLERPRVDSSLLIVLPGAEADSGLLLPVARGRVLERSRIRWKDKDWREEVCRVCYDVRLEELRAESVFAPADLTPSLIVTSWLDRREPDEGQVFDLERLDASRVTEVLAAGVEGPAAA
jgi:excinuclease UvrABC nuclease subunit